MIGVVDCLEENAEKTKKGGLSISTTRVKTEKMYLAYISLTESEAGGVQSTKLSRTNAISICLL